MFNEKIICCYLYPITKYGYPPPADNTILYLEEMNRLGFTSVELEGVREDHLLMVYKNRFKIRKKLDELNLKLPFFCAVLPGLSSLDEEIRNKNIVLFEIGCKIAVEFNSEGILDNAPIPPYIFPDDIPIVRHYERGIFAECFFPERLFME